MFFFQIPWLPEFLLRLGHAWPIGARDPRARPCSSDAISDDDLQPAARRGHALGRAAQRTQLLPRRVPRSGERRHAARARAAVPATATSRCRRRGGPSPTGQRSRRRRSSSGASRTSRSAKELTVGMEPLFSGPFEVRYIPDSGHWVQQEQPELVNRGSRSSSARHRLHPFAAMENARLARVFRDLAAYLEMDGSSSSRARTRRRRRPSRPRTARSPTSTRARLEGAARRPRRRRLDGAEARGAAHHRTMRAPRGVSRRGSRSTSPGSPRSRASARRPCGCSTRRSASARSTISPPPREPAKSATCPLRRAQRAEHPAGADSVAATGRPPPAATVLPVVEDLARRLAAVPGVARAGRSRDRSAVAARRSATPTCSSVARRPATVMDAFVALPEVERVLGTGRHALERAAAHRAPGRSPRRPRRELRRRAALLHREQGAQRRAPPARHRSRDSS